MTLKRGISEILNTIDNQNELKWDNYADCVYSPELLDSIDNLINEIHLDNREYDRDELGEV